MFYMKVSLTYNGKIPDGFVPERPITSDQKAILWQKIAVIKAPQKYIKLMNITRE